MKTFKQYLILQEDIIKILRDLKKKISYLLGEDVSDDDIEKYMNFLATFEQFLRHLDSKHTDLDDVIGIGKFIITEKLNIDELLKFISQYLKTFEKNETVNFGRIAKQRSDQFIKWFKTKSKDGLDIINTSTDYVLNKLEKYKLHGRQLGV